MRIYSYRSSVRPQAKLNRRLPLPKFPWRPGNWNFKRLLLWLFRLVAVGVLGLALLFAYYAKDLPDPNKLTERQVSESTKIYDRNGELLYEVHGLARRTLVGLDQVADPAERATIAIEDKDFYRHRGVSISGILRSVLRYAVNLGPQGGGGSTITQQFVKNAILNSKKTPDRKLREVILSLSIEARFSKDEILKLYLNEIPYGRNVYGIEAASESYYGKKAADLTLAESAYLAAMIQSPTRYNPLGPNRSLLDGRKDYVLSLMREQGYATADEVDRAKKEEVKFLPPKATLKAPHFTLWVQDYLAAKYGEKTLQEGGLKVYTTLDLKLQEAAEQAVRDGVEKNAKKYNAHNAALVAIDPKTGQVLAMVGSRDYFGQLEPEGCTPGKDCLFEPNFNAAISPRQPGSSFKPYVYATAFKKEHGYSPASMLVDVTTNFGTFGGKAYIPQNYDGSEHGPLPVRKALAGSLNIPAVKTLALVGVENAVQTARDLGITSPLKDCGLSLVLGGCEVKLVDHVAAYAAIANAGVKNPRAAIMKVQDRDGKVLEEFAEHPEEALDPEAAYELVSIMTDNQARSFVFGASSPLTLPDRKVAAKTGTTQKWHDGWTVGFTPQLAAGVWAGNNDGTLMKRGADGVLVAAPIWNSFMKAALKGVEPEDFKRPDGIREVVVDELSGKLPSDVTPTTKTEVFASYAVPKEVDDVHVKVQIDSDTGLPATVLTPPEKVTERVYTVLHSERPNDPDWENPVRAWAQTHGYDLPLQNGSSSPTLGGNGEQPVVSVVEPEDGGAVNELPFTVTVAVASQKPVARVDISIDGQLIKSLTQSPYTVSVEKNFGTGRHTLAVKAVDTSGSVGETSSQFTLSAPNPNLFP